jgi:hypothetical protein
MTWLTLTIHKYICVTTVHSVARIASLRLTTHVVRKHSLVFTAPLALVVC